jgi:hypothetical protein
MIEASEVLSALAAIAGALRPPADVASPAIDDRQANSVLKHRNETKPAHDLADRSLADRRRYQNRMRATVMHQLFDWSWFSQNY